MIKRMLRQVHAVFTCCTCTCARGIYTLCVRVYRGDGLVHYFDSFAGRAKKQTSTEQQRIGKENSKHVVRRGGRRGKQNPRYTTNTRTRHHRHHGQSITTSTTITTKTSTTTTTMTTKMTTLTSSIKRANNRATTTQQDTDTSTCSPQIEHHPPDYGVTHLRRHPSMPHFGKSSLLVFPHALMQEFLQPASDVGTLIPEPANDIDGIVEGRGENRTCRWAVRVSRLQLHEFGSSHKCSVFTQFRCWRSSPRGTSNDFP